MVLKYEFDGGSP
jgi:hypothetical protein